MYTSLHRSEQSAFARSGEPALRGASARGGGHSFRPMLDNAAAQSAPSSAANAGVPDNGIPNPAERAENDQSWLIVLFEFLDSFILAPVADEAVQQEPATIAELHQPQGGDSDGVEEIETESALPISSLEKLRRGRLQFSAAQTAEYSLGSAGDRGNDAVPVAASLLSPAELGQAETQRAAAGCDSSLPGAAWAEAPAAAPKILSAQISYGANSSAKTLAASPGQRGLLGREVFQLFLRVPQALSGSEASIDSGAIRNAVPVSSSEHGAPATSDSVEQEAAAEQAPPAPTESGTNAADDCSPRLAASEGPARPPRVVNTSVDPPSVEGIESILNPPLTFAIPPVSVERAPTARHAAAAPTTPAAASEIVAPVRKLTPAAHVQNMSVLVRGSDQVVRLQIRQTGGSVRVTIHAGDALLAQQLTDSLPQLVNNLDRQGYEPRVALPQAPGSVVTLNAETAKTDVRSGSDGNSESAAYDQPRQQRQRNPRRAWQELAFQLHS